MPKQGLTEIIVIMDRSGSMSFIAPDSIGGFNSFIKSQKEVPGEAKVTLVLFDHEYRLVHDGKPINEVPDLDSKTYVPRGNTALYDAIGRTLDDVGKRLAITPEHERPEKVLVAILTDGQENASTDYTRPQISEAIKHQQEAYKWEFIFLAANQDAFAGAASLSIPTANSVNFSASSAGMKSVYGSLDNMTRSYRSK